MFHKHKDKCLTPNLKEEDIKLKFLKAYNLVMEDKRRIIQDSEEIIELLIDTTKIDDEIRDLDDELFITSELVSKLVNENLKISDSIDNYNKKYEELSSRYDKLQAKREEPS